MSRNAWRWGAVVVIPAHNEADRIADTLRSVVGSLDHSVAAGIVVADAAWVVLVADACRDDTAAVGKAVLATVSRGRGRVVSTDARNVGAARRLGCDIGLRLLGNRPAERVWLAHTDADTIVPAQWLSRHLTEADRGARAVAGIVRVDSFAEHPPHLADRFIAGYAVYPDGSHPHVHGANLGTRADVYRDAGGWFDTPLSEDHCLWNRIRANHRVNATVRSWVTTSGRGMGRAAGGFADTLRVLGQAP